MENTGAVRFQAGNLKIEVHPTREAAGKAAAQAAALSIREFSAAGTDAGIIFAAAASQIETLRQLTARNDVPWDRVVGFHMDSYVGLPDDHPASFVHFLNQHLNQHVTLKQFFPIDGMDPDPARVCQEYAAKLLAAKPQLCLAGIGENGHLAFNEPPADFKDLLEVKIVPLDGVTREQQVAEGWFPSLDAVPIEAITLTVPAVLRAQRIIASVPGPRKAEIMRRVVEEDISPACPATILRTHPDATVFLDSDSAAKLKLP